MKRIKYVLFLLMVMFGFTINVNALEEVAQINDTKYETLESAVEAVNEGETITLLKDLDLTNHASFAYYVMDFPNNVTLDLNSYTIKSLNAGVVYQGNDLTIKNGSFVTPEGNSYALFVGDETETSNYLIENVTTDGGINVYDAHNVVLKDVEARGHDYYAVWADENASVVIENGQYTVNGNNGLLGVTNDNSTDVPMLIKSGLFITNDGKLYPGEEYAKFTIEGGSFNCDVSRFVAGENVAPSYGDISIIRPKNELVFYDGYGNRYASITSNDSFNDNYSLLLGISNTENSEEEVVNNIKSFLEKSMSNKKIEDVEYLLNYDISITDGTNIVTLDEKEYTVKLPLNPDYDYGKIVIAHMNDSGNVEEIIEPNVYDDYLTFKTTHFSDFVVLRLTASDIDVPSTGDNIAFYIIVSVISLISVIGISLYVKRNI